MHLVPLTLLPCKLLITYSRLSDTIQSESMPILIFYFPGFASRKFNNSDSLIPKNCNYLEEKIQKHAFKRSNIIFLYFLNGNYYDVDRLIFTVAFDRLF